MAGDSARARYDALRETNPELFTNPPDAPFTLAGRDEVDAEPAWAGIGVVFEDWQGLTLHDPVRTPTGEPAVFARRINPGNVPGVVVLPVVDGQVILLRHFRHSTREWHFEVPRGFGEPGSTSEENARRELHEEIGATPSTLLSLGVVYPDTGQSATPVELFYAEVPGFGEVARAEGIESVRLVSPKELAELIRTGEVTDGFTISAYTRAHLRGLLS